MSPELVLENRTKEGDVLGKSFWVPNETDERDDTICVCGRSVVVASPRGKVFKGCSNGWILYAMRYLLDRS